MRHTFLVPTMLAMVLEHAGIDSATLRAALDRLRRLADRARPAAVAPRSASAAIFAQTYGQAESPMVITCLKPEDHDRVGSCGRPFTIVDVAVFDDERPAAAAGRARRDRLPRPADDGLLLEQSGSDGEAFRNGWLHTGDIGYMDSDGFFYLVDRKNDMLISGGYNVYPREVEDVLLACEGVVEAAVVGLPDEKWGDRVYAVVSGRPGLDADRGPGARARKARQLQASQGRRDLAGTAEDLRQQDPASRRAGTARRAGKTGSRRGPRGDANVNDMHLVMHGLAIKKHATPEDVASGVWASTLDAVRETLGKLVAAQARASRPRAAICSRRRRACCSTPITRATTRSVRANPGFQAGYAGFERLNGTLKQLITDWQTIAVRGQRVPNDHSDKDYDAKIIDRLGDLHERAEAVARAARQRPAALAIYRDKLERRAREGRKGRDRLGERRQDRELPHRLVRAARRPVAPDAARTRANSGGRR